MTPRLITLFLWQGVRDLTTHRLMALLNVLSIALGVAVYLAIQIANASASRSFSAAVDVVAGKAHLEVRGDVDETLWPKIRDEAGILASTPLVEGMLTLPDFPGEYLHILGVDLFTNDAFRTVRINERGDLWSHWLTDPGAVALSKEFAQKRGLKLGDRIRVLANTTMRELTVAALLSPEESPAAAHPRFAAMDIGWAQELFDSQGRLSAIQILLETPNRALETAAALRKKLPDHLKVEPPRQRSFQMQQMIGAFQLNLSALSMVSMLVGAFLIYTSVSASVTRRRVEIGVLRTLGATRLEIRMLFLAQAAFLGFTGVALGAIAGIFLAQGLVGAVARTISSLYMLVSIDRSLWSLGDLMLAATFGLGSVLAGAWLPAAEATRVEPVEALSPGAHAQAAVETGAPGWQSIGWGFLAGASLLAWITLEVGPPSLSFGVAFLLLVAFALFSPAVTLGFARGASALLKGFILLRLSAENLGRSVHRTGITVGALSVALAMTTALSVMIYSFRTSVSDWVEGGIVADLFVAPASNELVGLGAPISPAIVSWLRAQPSVQGVDTYLERSVELQGATAVVSVVDGVYRGNLQVLGGGADVKMAQVFAGNAVAVSESFSRKFRIREGQTLSIPSPSGPVRVEVAAVFADYSRDAGIISMARSLFEKSWTDPRVQSLAVYLAPNARWEPVAEALRAQFSSEGELSIYSNKALRERVLSVFDQTFAVTGVLRSIAVVVALAGIFLTVTTLVAERSHLIGLLRAMGASNIQIQALFMTESAFVGLLACGLGAVAGLLLSLVLTEVVNPAFFGWSIHLHFPWRSLAVLPLAIVPAAVAAAWYPAWRATRGGIAQKLREA
jgi:putative ABC transport system permease protein